MKIVLVGAGSAQFGCGTLGDIFNSTALEGSEITLLDINAQALDGVLQTAKAFIEKHSLDEAFYPKAARVDWLVPPSGRRDQNFIEYAHGWFERLDRDAVPERPRSEAAGRVLQLGDLAAGEEPDEARGDRRTGEARNDFVTVHVNRSYDFEVDGTQDARANADSVIAAWRGRQPPGAFARLRISAA